MNRKLLQVGKRVKITKTDDTCIIGTIIEKTINKDTILNKNGKKDRVKDTTYTIMTCYANYISEKNIKDVEDYSYIEKGTFEDGYYLLGRTKNVKYLIERPRFESERFYSKIKIYKKFTNSMQEISYQDFKNLIYNLNDTITHPVLRDKYIFTFIDLIESYDTLTKVSEMFYRGSSGISDYTILKDIELYNNTNEKIKLIIKKLDEILCPMVNKK